MSRDIFRLAGETSPKPKGRKARPLADRFWAKVDKDGPVVRPELGSCWIWTAASCGRGYGHIRGEGDRAGKFLVAHRLSWELCHGEVPTDVGVLHRCDNRACVRPDHLFLGTQADNQRDMSLKERQPNRKLTSVGVLQIRRLHSDGTPITALADRYSVSKTTVSEVVTHKRWRHA
jgi:hypothetical protein